MSLNRTPPTPSGTRVLLVEDEPKLRDSLTEGLRLEDWSVTPVATGAEARHQLADLEFDLVVLDWMLPDGDSLEIVHHLRAAGNHVPVLMITARGAAHSRDRALEAGVNGYLPKPFSFSDFLAQTRALIANAL